MCSQQDWHKRLHTPDQFPPPKKNVKGEKKVPRLKKVEESSRDVLFKNTSSRAQTRVSTVATEESEGKE